MNNTAKVCTAICAGVAVGAIVGILVAPDKGRETIRKMNKQGKKFAGDIQEKFEKMAGKMGEMKEDIQKAVKEKVEEFV
jgi:gas vesicle protein